MLNLSKLKCPKASVNRKYSNIGLQRLMSDNTTFQMAILGVNFLKTSKNSWPALTEEDH